MVKDNYLFGLFKFFNKKLNKLVNKKMACAVRADYQRILK
ncbi:hypothetical protein RCH19_000738 [Flavobacterium sp. PL12]|uniref:Uncharacterized protein n=1 Tax=Flavobacterium weaverense TaxID=271156 RepID=A0A3L9ZUX7_9FLAO|nr:hypothetical protein BC961_1901 [Flavobacterium weaverense]